MLMLKDMAGWRWLRRIAAAAAVAAVVAAAEAAAELRLLA